MKKTGSAVLLVVIALFAAAGVYWHRASSSAAPAAGAPVPDLLLIRVKGKVTPVQGNMVLTSGRGLSYALIGDKVSALKNYLNRDIEVLGAIKYFEQRSAGGTPVECSIEVISFGDANPADLVHPLDEEMLVTIQKRVEKKRQLREKILQRLKVAGAFDAVEGAVFSEERDVTGFGKVKHMLLRSDEGDVYLLPGLLENNIGKRIIAVGKEALPARGFSLKEGEITFHLQNVYYEESPTSRHHK